MKIALLGPPHSGKSVLRERLKRAILKLDSGVYPYVLTVNPDGEGSWFQESYERDQEQALLHRTAAKRPWTRERAEQFAEWARNASTPLTLLDMGGVIDDYTRLICGEATHAILLVPREADFPAWRGLCQQCSLVVLAELVSAYEKTEDAIYESAAVFRGEVHRLQRGELDSHRVAVDGLADFVLKRLGGGAKD